MHARIEQFAEPAANIAEMRAAQCRWANTRIRERLKFIRRLRRAIADKAIHLAAAAKAVNDRPLAEKLVSEVLPLADACRWMERYGERILTPRKFGGRGRPLWLAGSSFEVQRQPHGVVLVIGPSNYPLFLPAVQSLHALVSGNAVMLKPAPGTRAVASAFAKLTRHAGLDRSLLCILGESAAAAHQAIQAGIDKVVFTGSSKNGRAVLCKLIETNTPAVLELSGDDAVVVMADADVDLVLQALNFGAQLNGGNTCIAPRRIIVEEPIANCLLPRLMAAGLRNIPIQRVPNTQAALEAVEANEFGLGASIFSRNIAAARSLARQIKTGFVTINDLIVPTADPRMPFAGVKGSGYGSTRGKAGLLEMTFPHVVAVRSSRFRAHFQLPRKGDANVFAAWIRLAHGSGLRRLPALRELLTNLYTRNQIAE